MAGSFLLQLAGGRGAVVLHPFARSRANPVQRHVQELRRSALIWAETLGWRLGALAERPGQGLLAALPGHVAALQRLGETELDRCFAAPRPAAEHLLAPAGARAFAEVLEVVCRDRGFRLRANQIACAVSLLAGECVELRTGEGKTLAAALAALVAARAGVSCHVITVNDYLATRDCDMIRPMAARIGLSVAVVLPSMPDAARRAAYDADIVYGSNKTFVFDHLRDRREARVRPGALPRQMGQAFAICDEADSVLIDDATVPMILSETGAPVPESDLELFRALDAFVCDLPQGEGRIRDGSGNWRLSRAGQARLEAAARLWPHPAARSEDIIGLAEKALAARYRFVQGAAYVVTAGRVEMIDQSTGRLMPDRRWEFGQQQLVEIAAGVSPSAEARTVARLTQQTYFRQYRQLSGLTGTAAECRAELWAIYGLGVREVAPHAPDRLIGQGLRVFASAAARWAHVAARAEQIARDRAVLIGVNDVRETRALAAVFRARGREVAVLDALSEADEAALVAQAGRAGQITVATHLAGRGTDIALDAAVRAAGGLHVIIASAMASARLERQFFGRAGRAGDPGSYERAIWRGDRFLVEGSATRPLAVALLALMRLPAPRLQAWALARIQAGRDRTARGLRRKTLLREQKLTRQLGYL